MSDISRTPLKSNPETTQCLDRPTGRLAAVTRVRNEIEKLFESEEPDKEEIIRLFKIVKNKRIVFSTICDEIVQENHNVVSSEKSDFVEWYSVHVGTMLKFEDDIRVRIKHFHSELVIGDSASVFVENDRVSVRSHASSTSSARIRLAERKAKLNADKNANSTRIQLEDEQRKIDEQQLQLRRKKEQAEHQREEHEQLLLETELNRIENKNSTVHKTDNSVPLYGEFSANKHVNFPALKPFKLVPAADCDSKSTTNKPIDDVAIDNNTLLAQVLNKQNDISLSLVRAQQRGYLPKQEPDIFDGHDVTAFKPFTNAFQRMVEMQCDEDADKYYFLEKYTSGYPKQLVRSCYSNNLGIAFRKAMTILNKQYGNEYITAQAYLQKLEKWAPIKGEDPKALEELSLYLTSCFNLMDNLGGLSQLNSHKEIQNIILKLPYDMRKGWRSKTCAMLHFGEKVDFGVLVRYVSIQAQALNQPVFGYIKDPERNEKRGKVVTNEKSKKSFVIKSSYDNKANDSTTKLYCHCCKKENSHALNDCHFFKKKSYDERTTFIRNSALCFGCLSEGHRSFSCRRRLLCKICDKRHPTILHKPAPTSDKMSAEKTTNSEQSDENLTSSIPSSGKSEESASVFATKSKNEHFGRTLCASVPVLIRVKGKTNYLKTYMGLDGFATECFVDSKLLSKLGTEGEERHLQLTTMNNKDQKVAARCIQNIEIVSLDRSSAYCVPHAYALTDWPFVLSDAPRRSDIQNYEHLKDLPLEFLDTGIGILVGMNTPSIIKPLEVVSGQFGEPYATRHLFGWAVNGPVSGQGRLSSHCHRATAQQIADIERKIEDVYSQDFKDLEPDERCNSIEDELWYKKVSSSIHKLNDNHFEIGLPFREDNVQMPCNYRQVYGRLQGLKRRFQRDASLYEDYKLFMSKMINNNYLEKVPLDEINLDSNKKWFLVHHAVYHKQKNKLRVVFDCSLKNAGVCLNDKLLQGPDLANNLIGVLLRFREGRVALTADIESMFFQVRVPPEHANYMRILWFPDGDLDKQPVQYRLTSHTFGAVSSPSIANYALKQTAVENKNDCNSDAATTVLNNFYVDDLMKSLDSEEKAVALSKTIRRMVAEGGFNLIGFISNSRKVLSSVPVDALSKNYKTIDFEKDTLPQDRALGVAWKVDSDSLGFNIKIEDKELSRRGMLSTICSVFDPLGLAGPVIIPARVLFQETCRRKLEWSDELPEDIIAAWQTWIKEIFLLQQYTIPRCLREPFKDVRYAQLHIFCDGSQKAYGAVAYARFEDPTERVHCCIIMAKSRLTPLNNKSLKTIPRIELCAAKLATIVQQTLKKELTICFDEQLFWSDSMTVLKYINSDTARFQRFVANRVSFIRSKTEKHQWRFCPGKINIADLISRGTTVPNFIKDNTWKNGPDFLWKPREFWPHLPKLQTIDDNDNEVKKTVIVAAMKINEDNATNHLLKSSSDWSKTLYRVATWLRLISGLLSKVWRNSSFTVLELKQAEVSMWKFVQNQEFPVQISLIRSSKPLKSGDLLEKLSPCFNDEGLLCVGGRLNNSNEAESTKHPVILHANHYTVKLLVWYHHKKTGHMGRNYLLSTLREKYWIIGGNNLTRQVARLCIICRKINGQVGQQIMAPLPEERVASGNPAFFHTGIDFFGPFFVTRGRSRANEKRYGVVFTCLASRAIHLEVAHSLETDSFLNALRRFLARRGQVNSFISDNGTNLVGGCRELRIAIDEWNKVAIQQWALHEQIVWKFNPPTGSHFGGVWEREIRTARKVLNALICENLRRLDDETLVTLFCEVESILNNRPLSSLSDDPKDLRPLTPNHLLLLNPSSAPPPGVFDENDNYGRGRWRRAQYMANEFWVRWRREYLHLLQERQKWTRHRKPFKSGDLVLIVDKILPRNHWRIGRVSEVRSGNDGQVRTAKVRISQCNSGRNLQVATSEVERPIAKLIWLMSDSQL